jgi:hypothetical protein
MTTITKQQSAHSLSVRAAFCKHFGLNKRTKQRQ